MLMYSVVLYCYCNGAQYRMVLFSTVKYCTLHFPNLRASRNAVYYLRKHSSFLNNCSITSPHLSPIQHTTHAQGLVVGMTHTNTTTSSYTTHTIKVTHTQEERRQTTAYHQKKREKEKRGFSIFWAVNSSQLYGMLNILKR